MFSRISALAKITFHETLRKKPLITLLIFSFIFIGSLQLLLLLKPEIQIKVMEGIGLRSLVVFGILLAIYLGASLLSTGEKRKLYSLLPLPLRRGEVIIGKFIGGALALLVLFILMAIVFISVIGLRKFFNILTLKALLLIIWEIFLLFSLSLMFSIITTIFLNISLSLFISIMGNLSAYLKSIGEKSDNLLLIFFARLFYYLIPHLDNFNVTSRVIAKQNIPLTLILKNIAYGVSYIAIFLGISVYLFSKKEV